MFAKCRYSLNDFNPTLFIEINQTLLCLAAVDNQAVDKP